jgi:hypothetical protein
VLYAVFGSWEAACGFFGLCAPGSGIDAPGESERREAKELARARRDAEISAANTVSDLRSAECIQALDWHYQDGRRVAGPRPVTGGYAWVLK